MRKEIFLALKVQLLCFDAPLGTFSMAHSHPRPGDKMWNHYIGKGGLFPQLELLPFCGLLILCAFPQPAWDKRWGWEESLQLCRQIAILHILPYSKYRFGVRSSLLTHANSTPLPT